MPKYHLNDKLLVSPYLTHLQEWVVGSVIDVEDNPFNGWVYSVKTDTGDIFSETENFFKPVEA
ncbi:MAG: transcriptional regulator [Alloprevotella sp.]|nr:transcriptional regulator [Alloprevotella sp.]